MLVCLPCRMDHSKWKHLIGHHLGRSVTKRTRELMLDLLLVDGGLRSALLLDFAVHNVACVHSFLDALKLSDLLKNRLVVVVIDQDVLIVNPTVFERVGNSCEKYFSSVMFVDVSANLDSPQAVPHTSECLEQTKTSFYKFLVEKNESDSMVLPVQLEDGSLANPTTLFGLFLGYPLVYFYNMSLDSQHNCLSMIPLIQFAVKGAVLESGGVAVQAEHTVLSFTAPQVLGSQIEDKVETWFQEKRDSQVWRNVFTDLKLQTKVVQLPRVCL